MVCWFMVVWELLASCIDVSGFDEFIRFFPDKLFGYPDKLLDCLDKLFRVWF